MLWFYFILGFIFTSHCFKLTQALPYAKTRKIKFKSRIKLNHDIYDWEFHCVVIGESAKKASILVTSLGAIKKFQNHLLNLV